MNDGSLETATLGGGCFWCVEAALAQVDGVEDVVSGYSGGEEPDPSYRAVCTGTTGHAEVVQLEFDPETISFRELLEIFFTIHDPTTENRQGNDVGAQYRSVIFCHSDDQRDVAEDLIEELDASGDWDDPIVTDVEPFETFFEAEDYHQDYYGKNPDQPYCEVIIEPKLEKLRDRFADRLGEVVAT